MEPLNDGNDRDAASEDQQLVIPEEVQVIKETEQAENTILTENVTSHIQPPTPKLDDETKLSVDDLLAQIRLERERYQQLRSDYESLQLRLDNLREPQPINSISPRSPMVPFHSTPEWKGKVYLDVSIGISHDKNKKFMEDDYFAMKLHGPGNIWLMAGVCDGHSMDGKSGKKAAQLVRNNLPTTILSTYDADSRNPMIFNIDFSSVVSRSFDKMEKLMHSVSEDLFFTAGCTTSLIAITGSPLNSFDQTGNPVAPAAFPGVLGQFTNTSPRSPTPMPQPTDSIPRLPHVVAHGERELLCANVGDSEVYLFPSDPTVDFIEMTRCHLATDPEERQRCKDAGADVTDDTGSVYGNRVNGMQVTRSIGDFFSEQTISTPDIKQLSITPDLAAGTRFDIKTNDTDQYAIPPPSWVVLATDGFWDVVPPWNCHQLITTFIGTSVDGPFPATYPNPQRVASRLLAVCIERYNNPDIRVSPFPPGQASAEQYSSSSTHNPNKKISRDNVAIIVLRLDWKPLYEGAVSDAEKGATAKPKRAKRGLDLTELFSKPPAPEAVGETHVEERKSPTKEEPKPEQVDVSVVAGDEGEADGAKKKKKKKKKKKATGDDNAKDDE
ncbi:putative Protein phosphatase 2C [Blattamonas nauphoetae]|uniref:PPM-type phosphatase domain-containing protein n=1 Tax=Blattamonas nauphoetae TaxID=2049346 RepID=A0ABQ9YFI1_9EUKA|nr:putative Protein phosphatase 2C [Blattamonas nauphoetae]